MVIHWVVLRPNANKSNHCGRIGVGEPAGKGEPCPKAKQQNHQVFGGLDANFVRRPAFFVQLHALVAVAFKPVIEPQHDFGIHGLGAGIATPQAPCDGGPPNKPKALTSMMPVKINSLGKRVMPKM